MTNDCGFQFDTSYTDLPEVFYTYVHPAHVASTKMVILSRRSYQFCLQYYKCNERECFMIVELQNIGAIF